MSRSRRIVVNGLEIRERIVGQGQPLLMVHGWGANLELMQPLAQLLERYDYRLYMLDLPGFGESAEPPIPFSIFDYAAFCVAYLDFHGLEQVHYFGHSLGGRIGLILGSDHSGRVKSMVLSNSAGIKAKQSISSQLRLRLYQTVRKSLNRVGAVAIAEDLRQRYTKRYGSADFQSASAGMRKTLVNVVNQDLLANARRVSVPTVLIWGDADTATPLWMGKMLEKAIPDAALIVHEGAGHYAYLDNAQKTASIMNALYRSDEAQITR